RSFALVDLDAYGLVLGEHETSEEPLSDIERRRFDSDHQELGAELLRRWGLPDSVHVPIRHHHAPSDAPPAHRQTAELLYLADALATLYHGSQGAQLFAQLRATLSECFEQDRDIDELIDEVACRAGELLGFYDVGDPMIKPYSELL